MISSGGVSDSKSSSGIGEETTVLLLHRGGAVHAPLRSGVPKWRGNFPKESDHQATSNRLEQLHAVSYLQLLMRFDLTIQTYYAQYMNAQTD